MTPVTPPFPGAVRRRRPGALLPAALTAAALLWASPAGPASGPGTTGGPGGITLFLSGDVMTGRGVDQVLPHPGDPAIFESYMKDARGYVHLAEAANGPAGAPIDFGDLWGDALAEMDRAGAEVRIVNLETSVTDRGEPWPGKGIHYRMHPENAGVLTAARIDVCALANNHVLDWGPTGLLDTLDTLRTASIRTAGAGRDRDEARAPAVVSVPGKGRVVVLAFGMASSGIPRDWNAARRRPGVHRPDGPGGAAVEDIRRSVAAVKGRGDIVVASVHWGGNWGFSVPPEQRAFARRLVDEAGVDLVHGHSSHHVRPIEVYRGKLVLYGCGDLVNDYEGIGGREAYRPDLSLLYFARVAPSTGRLVSLEMTPTRLHRFRIVRARGADAAWLEEALNREGARYGTRVTLSEGGRLRLAWD